MENRTAAAHRCIDWNQWSSSRCHCGHASRSHLRRWLDECLAECNFCGCKRYTPKYDMDPEKLALLRRPWPTPRVFTVSAPVSDCYIHLPLPTSVVPGSFVYFIQALNDSGPIKIGFSRNPAKRIEAINTFIPVHPLLIRPGSRSTEQVFHGRFGHLRLAGEWFSPGNDLLTFIARERTLMGLPDAG